MSKILLSKPPFDTAAGSDAENVAADSNSSNTGLIVGIVIAAVVICGIVIFVLKGRKQK